MISRVCHSKTKLLIWKNVLDRNKCIQMFQNDPLENFTYRAKKADWEIVRWVWRIIAWFRDWNNHYNFKQKLYVKKVVALRGMFLRSILRTPSQPSAFPFFSFLIIFLISRGHVYEEQSSLNTSLYRAEHRSSYLGLKRAGQNVKKFTWILMLWRWPF
jgi:hypothetical protein